MENEDRLREIDRQMIAALAPDDGAVRRVLGAVFRERRAEAGPLRHAIVAVAIAVSVAAVAGGAFHWRPGRLPSRAELTITGTGSSIVVERTDGKRWFFGPAPDPDVSRGSYVIVIPNQGVLK